MESCSKSWWSDFVLGGLLLPIFEPLPCRPRSLPAPVPWRKLGWGVGGAQLLTHLLPALAEPMEAGRCWREEAGGGDSVRGDSAALRRAQGWR